MDKKQAFNELPSLPPQFELNNEILLKCGNARASLGELKALIESIPKPDFLINTISLIEVKSSNQIENIVTTTEKMLRFSENSHQADPETKEALRYQVALKKACQKPISISLMEEIVSIVKNKPLSIRSVLVWIGNHHQVLYVPPDNRFIIEKLLENWIEFMDSSNFDPLIQMAILHYQFEAIHPFIDGNGRAGRILNLSFLLQKQILSKPVLYLSQYLSKNRQDYYRLLREVTENNNWNDWILYMLDALEQTSKETLSHIKAILRLMKETEEYLAVKLGTLHRRDILMEVLFAYPYCRSSHLQAHGIKSPITSLRYLRKLVDLGVLKEERKGKELVFIHEKYVKLLL